MLEVEMKFRVDHGQVLQERLRAAATQPPKRQLEVDHYFNAPDRDFARTDEALRLRQVGENNCLTYKGPKLDALTKTRTEIEVSLPDGSEAVRDMTALLQALGYRPVAVVRKTRTLYRLESQGYPVTVSLDEVEGLDLHVELEILAPEQQQEAARQAVLSLASRLGLSAGERRSYLELWLARRGNQPG
jgi:adenylate cyclase class 2